MGNGTDILIIDDDRDLVNTMRIVLESKTYQVRAAYNGKEGYAELEKKIPDVIILDVMMSTDTEGFDLAHKLQRSPQYKGIPILMHTGVGTLRLGMKNHPGKFLSSFYLSRN